MIEPSGIGLETLAESPDLSEDTRTVLRRELAERERLIEELRNYKDRLEELVADRTAELEQALKQLKGEIEGRRNSERARREAERVATMGSVIGAVANEIRNPLFALSSTVEALEARLGGGADPGPFFGAAREQVDRLAGLVTELLEYARPCAPELVPGLVPAVLDRAVELCRPLASRYQVQLSLSLSPELPLVALDFGRLAGAFENVIENAIEHSPPGSTVVISADGAKGAEEAPDGESPGVVCVIRDRGCGFSAQHLSRVFEPFYTQTHGGAGLGLAVAWRIVRDHEGTISASNSSQGGGVVTVTLPGCPDDAA